MRRVLITGSRDWDDWATLCNAINNEYILGNHATEMFRVVHGACPSGADRMADEWCSLMEMEPERYPADWEHFGKWAGPIRNREMIRLGADVCLAFIKNGSRGATGTVKMAIQVGIPVKVWTA